MSLDVADWLRGLGLEQYVSAFRDSAIDAEVLPSLTAEDLRDTGRHSWSAIAAGCSTPSRRLKSEASSSADRDAAARARADSGAGGAPHDPPTPNVAS